MAAKTYEITLVITTLDGDAPKEWNWNAMLNDPDLAATCTSARKLRSTPDSHIRWFKGEDSFDHE